MEIAWLLTLLALGGVAAGVYLGQSGALSSLLAAAGGGLLFGLSIFRLIPEIGEQGLGWTAAVGLVLLVASALAAVDRLLLHAGHSPRQGVLWPLFGAMLAHSFFDGWSVRALAGHAQSGIAAPIGLALHKVPEGIATGWIARRSIGSDWKAVSIGGATQLVTLVGAFIEPSADRLGWAQLGPWWPAIVLATIAGSFLFLGFHAVLPHWKSVGLLAVFVVTAALVASASFLH